MVERRLGPPQRPSRAVEDTFRGLFHGLQLVGRGPADATGPFRLVCLDLLPPPPDHETAHDEPVVNADNFETAAVGTVTSGATATFGHTSLLNADSGDEPALVVATTPKRYGTAFALRLNNPETRHDNVDVTHERSTVSSAELRCATTL